MPDSKKAKVPKIVQIRTNIDGLIAAVLYSDGRVFQLHYTKYPDKNSPAEGWWGELMYPDLKQFSKP